jgi:hypothetical protein
MDLTRKIRRIRPLACLLQIVLLLPASALGQFIGFTAPQTEQQTLTTNHACAGGVTPQGDPQDFIIQNLGQTEHYLKVLSDGHASHLSVEIIGVNATGQEFIISDILEMAGTATGSLFAAGYFPRTIVRVFCTPIASTYTLAYSGSWGTPPPNFGNYMQTQIDKQLFAAATGTALSESLIPPYGSSAGELFFRFTSAPATGATIAVACTSVLGGGISWAAVILSPQTLTSGTTTQAFQVPNFPCPTMQVNYTGAAGPTVSIAYAFATAGFSNWPLATGTPVTP